MNIKTLVLAAGVPLALAACTPAQVACYSGNKFACPQARVDTAKEFIVGTAAVIALATRPPPPQQIAPQPGVASAVTEVALTRTRGGGFTVPATISGTMTLPFRLDTGADVVVIPWSIAEALARNGSLARNDLLGPHNYGMANGSSQHSVDAMLHSITVGGRTVTDVRCAIVNDGGGLLLGQTFLQRFPGYSVDNAHGILRLPS